MVGTESPCIDKFVFPAVLFTFGRKASVSTIKSKPERAAHWRWIGRHFLDQLHDFSGGGSYILHGHDCVDVLFTRCSAAPRSPREGIFHFGFDCNRRLTEDFSGCRDHHLLRRVSASSLVDHQTKIIADLRSHVGGPL